MSLFVSLLVGIVVGGIASYAFYDTIDTLIINIVIAIAGAIAGLVSYFVLVASPNSTPLFSVPGTLFSAVGASSFTLIFTALHHSLPKPAAPPGHAKEDPLDED